MRFIHTADWHLGNSLHDIDRSRECNSFLVWLKAQIKEQEAEALVVAGDIFDTINPPNWARQMLADFLADLYRDTSCRNVIIVGGNHDSGAMLESYRQIFNIIKVNVIGAITNHQPADFIQELVDKEGQVAAICCVAPYIRELDLANYAPYRGTAEQLNQDSVALLHRFYGELTAMAVARRGDRHLPLIATGHLYLGDLGGRETPVDGADPQQVDDGVEDIIGNLGQVPPTIFPPELDYVALGHIHYATAAGKSGHIYYSGSPFVMGFDEARTRHYVLLVDVEQGQYPRVKRLLVPTTVRYEQFKGDLKFLQNSLKRLAEELQKSAQTTYVDLILDDVEAVNLSEALAEYERNKPFEVKRHRFARKSVGGDSLLIDDAAESIEQYSLDDYIKMLIREKLPTEIHNPDIQVEKLFTEYKPLLDEAKELARLNMAGLADEAVLVSKEEKP